jgi:hypothetical protein
MDGVVEQLAPRLVREADRIDAGERRDRRVRRRDRVQVQPRVEHRLELPARGRRRDQALGVRPHRVLAVELALGRGREQLRVRAFTGERVREA